MTLPRLLAVFTLLLHPVLAPVLAQGTPAPVSQADAERWARAEAAYGDAMNGAKQVLVYAPLLTDGSFVNALKVQINLDVPVTIVTTRRGLLQRNGLLLTLTLQALANDRSARYQGNPVVKETGGGGDPHLILQVQTAQGWRAYYFESGLPVPLPFSKVQSFNTWYAKYAGQLQLVSPVVIFKTWAKANLGEQLY